MEKAYYSLVIDPDSTYPFGMVMPGRSWTVASAEGYRFGFNGKEGDGEIKGEDNSLDFGARIYDPRLGKWISCDEELANYPDLSPYIFANNNPVYYIDPDGKTFIVADEAQQAIVLSYMRDQLGSDLYSFNKKGEMKLDKKSYKSIENQLNQEQIDIISGFNTIIDDKKIIETIIYPNKDINFSRNPLIPVREEYIDPVTNEIKSRIVYKEEFEGGKGYIIPELKNGGITISVVNDDHAFVLINQEASKTGVFETSDAGKTDACESCIWIHEVLDHGLDYINSGKVEEPPGSTKSDNVNYHNKALRNKKSKERSGGDHL